MTLVLGDPHEARCPFLCSRFLLTELGAAELIGLCGFLDDEGPEPALTS